MFRGSNKGANFIQYYSSVKQVQTINDISTQACTEYGSEKRK